MERLFGFLVVVGMTVLRLAVPAAVTVIASYLLRRLDARWHPAAAA
jgi:hypothetical protein